MGGRPDGDRDLIPGRRAVLEALRAGRPIRKLLLGRTARRGGVIAEIADLARQRRIPLQAVDVRRLDDLAPGRHQGVVALASVRPPVTVPEILAAAARRGERPWVVILDGVEDPVNLGAVLRTAEGAGVHGVIIPRRRAVGLTPAAARASAGAIEYVPVAQVTNLVQTIEELKRAGLWVVGADPQGPEIYHQVDLRPPLALVLGGEGQGISRLVREHCDRLVRLPMRGRIASLNVAVAAGVLLFEVARQQTTLGPGVGKMQGEPQEPGPR